MDFREIRARQDRLYGHLLRSVEAQDTERQEALDRLTRNSHFPRGNLRELRGLRGRH